MMSWFRAVLIGLAVVFVLPLGGCQTTSLDQLSQGIFSGNQPVAYPTTSTQEKICKDAIADEGAPLGWVDKVEFQRSVQEAKSRGHTPQTCAALLGRLPTAQKELLELCRIAVLDNGTSFIWDYRSAGVKRAASEAKQLGQTPDSCAALLGKTQKIQIAEVAAPSRLGTKEKYLKGRSYYYGNGVRQDYKEAAKWYGQAARQGHHDAQYNLGAMYHIGEGVPKDLNKAANWYQLAANQGHPTAKYARSVLNEKKTKQATIATPPNKLATSTPNPIGNLKLLAEQGDAESQYSLGLSYDLGQYVSQDTTKAMKWYRLAGNQGHISAQLTLADMLIGNAAWNTNHTIAPENLEEGAKWLKLAADSGAVSARDKLRSVIHVSLSY